MKILFLHGWHSTLCGVKPTYLKEHGHLVLNPALPDDDFEAAVRIAQAEFDKHHPEVVVGSSRGGAVAMNIDYGSTPLVLLCPAWKRWGTAKLVIRPAVILHSKTDETIPFVDSRELWRNSHLPPEALIKVGHEHRLADPVSLKQMLAAVEKLTGPKAEVAVRPGGTPRQFGIGTLLLITTMYAVLFALLRAMQLPPLQFAAIAAFFTLVGLAQTFLFKWRRPRLASMIAGVLGWLSINWVVFSLESIDPRLCGTFVAVGIVYGPVFGCLAGLLITGVIRFSEELKAPCCEPDGGDGSDVTDG